MSLLKSFNTFIKENLADPAETSLPKEWVELQSSIPAQNFKPYDITQQVIAQGGKVPEKLPTLFWKNASQYLEISLAKNKSEIDVKYSNDRRTNVIEIQEIFDADGVRNHGLEWNGSDTEAGGTLQIHEVSKNSLILNKILNLMGITK